MDKRMIILCVIAFLLGIAGILTMAVYIIKDNGKKENKQNNRLACKNSIAIKDDKKYEKKDDKVDSFINTSNDLKTVIESGISSLKEQIINGIKTSYIDDSNIDHDKVIKLLEDILELVNLEKRLESPTFVAGNKIEDLKKWVVGEISNYNPFKNTISLQYASSYAKDKIAKIDQFKKWLIANLGSYIPSKTSAMKPLDLTEVKVEESVISSFKDWVLEFINKYNPFHVSSNNPSNSESVGLIKDIVDWIVEKMRAYKPSQKDFNGDESTKSTTETIVKDDIKSSTEKNNQSSKVGAKNNN
ncbi:hypothetical protein NGRA_2804 [Nosema granulosis]|uniref:Uncharacterized protein n=1 Tax=Nosema granulosis TaxID=83296 RepID=A0A9P6GYM4_9MICR|nr:hypothetical protein NGRA_2804 [Nosema granulosis]